MGLVYLTAILVSTACMLLVDRRWRLFFWHDPLGAAILTAVGTAFLLAWDVVGIGFGVFLRGTSSLTSGIVLAPELPIEEPLFLVFLSICTMVVYTGAVRMTAARNPNATPDREGERT